MKVIYHLPFDVLYHHFKVLILLQSFLFLSHWLLHYLFVHAHAPTNKYSSPLSRVASQYITLVVSILPLTIIDEAATTAAAWVIRTEGVLDGGSTAEIT